MVLGMMLRRMYASIATVSKTESCNVAARTRNLRNIAIIAHVDHGKTSLVDCLLTSAKAHKQAVERVMDSNDLERERGITIFSKNASVFYNNHHINIIDTPGHADFGGEVERVMSMVDGCLLVVDATEGPMTQTRFVLSKALQQNLKPIVVINKCDRPTARLNEVESEVLDLFLNLDASDEQLNYPVIYASAKEGWAVADLKEKGEKSDVSDLLQAIIDHIPAPKHSNSSDFRMLTIQLQSDKYVGRCALGKVESGSVAVGDAVKLLTAEGKTKAQGKVLKIFQRQGLDLNQVESAQPGDIVSVAGLETVSVNDTICSMNVHEAIKAVPIDPPTVAMTFSVNDSPFQGQDGSKLTSNMIRDRLLKEVETNVAMQVLESNSKDSFEVRGRGELHIGILVENMRREGYEFSVSPPRVLLKKQDGQVLEPIEECLIDVPTVFSGSVIQKLTKRKGELQNFQENGEMTRLSFKIPSRGLMGYPSEFKNDTSGQGVINHIFAGYEPHKGDVDRSRNGSIVSTATGVATSHALLALEPRGVLFIQPGENVYMGAVIGEHNKWMDIEVNPIKTKHLTNVRAASKDDTVRLAPPKVLSLEQTLSYMQEDELLEVTPKRIRIRKKYLDPNSRKRNK